MKYIKRKAEHGVNAQYIMTSNHMGTHLDAPRHFVTAGMTIDEIPLEWLCGPGAIVDLRDAMDELELYTPKMIEERVEVTQGDLLILHTGWHRYSQFGAEPDEEKYIHRHPGAHPDLVPWLLEKEIHVWGVDCVSTDHPMNLPIGRFLGKGMHGHCDRVRAGVRGQVRRRQGGRRAVPRLRLPAHPQRALPAQLHAHREPGRASIDAPELQNKRTDRRLLPVEVQGRRGGVRARGGVRRRVSVYRQRAGEEDLRHREVDDEPGDVDERGDERRRGARGVEAEPPEEERQHRAAHGAPQHDADQADADGGGDQEVVLAVERGTRRCQSTMRTKPIAAEDQRRARGRTRARGGRRATSRAAAPRRAPSRG